MGGAALHAPTYILHCYYLGGLRTQPMNNVMRYHTHNYTYTGYSNYCYSMNTIATL